jgi:hypothetical protein
MRILLLALWGVAAFYFMLCIFVPEIRPYINQGRFWTGKEIKASLASCVGYAMALWLPALLYVGIILGLISDSYIFGVYLLAILGIVVAIIGSWIDILS